MKSENYFEPTFYTQNEITSISQKNALRYAKTYNEYQNYMQYYKNIYTKSVKAEGYYILNSENQIESKNAAAALVESAIKKQVERNLKKEKKKMQVPNGINGKRYSTPNVNKFIYMANIGYYYDPKTRLYYDKKSEYYYNGYTKKYLYWNNKKRTYVLAQTTETGHPIPRSSTEDSIPSASEQKLALENNAKVGEQKNKKKANKTHDTNFV